MRDLNDYDLVPSGSDCTLCNGLLAGTWKFNQYYAAEVCTVVKQWVGGLCVVYIYICNIPCPGKQRCLFTRKWKSLKVKSSVAFAARKMDVETVMVKLKVCLLETKTKHSPLGISTSCLEMVSEVRGTSSQGKKMFLKISDQLPREQHVSILTSRELWTLLALSSLLPWEMQSLWRKSSLFHEIFTLEKGRSFVYCHWPLEGGGGNCNQVSRSQFSQLHIIIWFRYLIHASKLKTCLELTIALLSHRLLCREIPSSCLPAAINLGTDHAWKHFVLNTTKKEKRNEEVKWKCLCLALLCVWWFFFFSSKPSQMKRKS